MNKYVFRERNEQIRLYRQEWTNTSLETWMDGCDIIKKMTFTQSWHHGSPCMRVRMSDIRLWRSSFFTSEARLTDAFYRVSIVDTLRRVHAWLSKTQINLKEYKDVVLSVKVLIKDLRAAFVNNIPIIFPRFLKYFSVEELHWLTLTF